MHRPSVLFVLWVWAVVYFVSALFAESRFEQTARVYHARHGDATKVEYFQLRFDHDGTALISLDRDLPLAKLLTAADAQRVRVNIDILQPQSLER